MSLLDRFRPHTHEMEFIGRRITGREALLRKEWWPTQEDRQNAQTYFVDLIAKKEWFRLILEGQKYKQVFPEDKIPILDLETITTPEDQTYRQELLEDMRKRLKGGMYDWTADPKTQYSMLHSQEHFVEDLLEVKQFFPELEDEIPPLTPALREILMKRFDYIKYMNGRLDEMAGDLIEVYPETLFEVRTLLKGKERYMKGTLTQKYAGQATHASEAWRFILEAQEVVRVYPERIKEFGLDTIGENIWQKMADQLTNLRSKDNMSFFWTIASAMKTVAEAVEKAPHVLSQRAASINDIQSKATSKELAETTDVRIMKQVPLPPQPEIDDPLALEDDAIERAKKMFEREKKYQDILHHLNAVQSASFTIPYQPDQTVVYPPSLDVADEQMQVFRYQEAYTFRNERRRRRLQEYVVELNHIGELNQYPVKLGCQSDGEKITSLSFSWNTEAMQKEALPGLHKDGALSMLLRRVETSAEHKYNQLHIELDDFFNRTHKPGKITLLQAPYPIEIINDKESKKTLRKTELNFAKEKSSPTVLTNEELIDLLYELCEFIPADIER